MNVNNIIFNSTVIMSNHEKIDENNDEKISQTGMIDSGIKHKEIMWMTEHEEILIEWADEAKCYKWLHDKENKTFTIMNLWFVIPVIIMSTVTGTANFAQGNFPENIRPYVPIIIGTVNILGAIIQTIHQFLKVSELNEAHRVSSISWDKFSRNIKTELAKRRSERISASHMMKTSKEEFDRLMETSPTIGEDTVKLFFSTFADASNGKDEQSVARYKFFLELRKPEICNELVSVRHSVHQSSDEFEQVSKQIEILGLRKRQIKGNTKQKIIDFVDMFIKSNNRKPFTKEVSDNMGDNIENELLKVLIRDVMIETGNIVEEAHESAV